MVTGRRAFAGDDVSDTLASVLRAEVAWTGVPPSLVRLLKKCLERDPRQRLHDIGDAWDLLDTGTTAQPVTQSRPWLAWGLAAVLAIVAAALAALHFSGSTPEPEVVRFQVHPPPKNNFDIYLALSPDGRHLAFTARDDAGTMHLWVRSLNALEARLLPGTEGAWSPFWSPDSRQIAFAVDRTLKKIDLSSGPPQTLGESTGIVGLGAWNRDGVIVFGHRGPGPLLRIPASGGNPTPITTVDTSRGENFHSFPQFLPDGRTFLYYRQSTTPEHQGLYMGSLDVGPSEQSTTRIVATDLGNSYVDLDDSGARLLFLREGRLMSQAFDASQHRVTGEAMLLVPRLASSGSFGFFSASSTGVLAYRTGSAASANQEQLTWLDRKGQPTGTIGEPRSHAQIPGSLALAPDLGSAVAALGSAPTNDLWIVEFARGIPTRFTFDPGNDLNPVWSPDGTRIVFRSTRGGAVDLYVKDGNGTADETVLMRAPEVETPTDWSADGRFLLFMKSVGPDSNIWLFSIADNSSVPILATSFNEGGAKFSADSRWIAYVSNESGRAEVYLRPFSVASNGKVAVGAKWQVSNSGVANNGLHWRRDGRELYYRDPGGVVMAVDVSFAGSLVRTALPRPLFALPPAVINWDASPDGQRFLVAMPVISSTPEPISVVLNWRGGQ
jgi:Tol biopolymer transport system component